MKSTAFIATFLVLVLIIGCEEIGQKTSIKNEVESLRLQKDQLKHQVDQCRSENEKFKQQAETLLKLDPEIRLDSLSQTQNVRVTRYTNLYDKDKDGRKETLIVYVQPFDEHGDAIKAAGSVDVQLWDLNISEENALLGQWNIPPEELKEIWFSTIVGSNFRLTFDVSGKVDKFEQPLTVKVVFTDYLTGKVFNKQKVINP